MAMVKEIMGQRMVEAFCSDVSRCSSQPNRFCIKRQKTVSLLPTFSELKTMLQLPAPYSQPSFIKLDESSKRDLALNPMSVTITGTITIKNSDITDHKEMMAMMLQHFGTFKNALHERGIIVLQLVSTEIDPSKPYLLCINNILILVNLYALCYVFRYLLVYDLFEWPIKL